MREKTLQSVTQHLREAGKRSASVNHSREYGRKERLEVRRTQQQRHKRLSREQRHTSRAPAAIQLWARERPAHRFAWIAQSCTMDASEVCGGKG